MSDETTTRILADPQDPLPEANWLWRRVFIFLVTTVVLFLVYGAVDRLGAVAVVRPEIGIPAFVSIVKLLVFTVNIMALFYMVAPSAEQITKLVKTAGLLRAGVQIATRATARKGDQVEETQATVGTPPQPIVPPNSVAPESAPSAPEPAPVAAEAPEAENGLPDAPWAESAAPPADTPFPKGR